MQLVLHLGRPVAAAKISHVKELFALQKRHGAGDDVDVVAHRHLRELLAKMLGETRQVTNGLLLLGSVGKAHQRRVEELREDNKIRLVVRHRIHEILHLLEHFFGAVKFAHLPLHGANAHLALLAEGAFFRVKQDVGPFQQGGVTLGFFILGQVLAQQPFYLEIVGQLEGENGVVNSFAVHFFDVLRRGQLVGMVAVINDTAAGQNGPQVETAAQLFARLVQPPAQAVATVFGVDKHIQAVEGIAVVVVGDGHAVGDEVVIGVGVGKPLVIHLHRQRHRHQLALVFNADLPLGELAYQGVDGVLGPGAANVFVDGVHQLLELGKIVLGELTDFQDQIFGAHALSSVITFFTLTQKLSFVTKATWQIAAPFR